MANEDEIQQALETLNNIADQKQEVLKDFKAKYAEIDKQVIELESKKASLLADIKTIEQAKDEAQGIIKKANADSIETIRAAEADARNIVDKASVDANSIIELAKEMKEDAENIISGAKVTADKAMNDVIKASNALYEANKALKDAEADRAEALKTRQEAEEKMNKAQATLYAVNREKESIEGAQESLNDLKKDEKRKIAVLDAEISKSFELNSALSVELAKTKAERESLEQKQKALDAEIAPLKAKLAEQADQNDWRSKELDIGFEKLKNDTDSLKKDQKKIEAMKKEILNSNTKEK